MGERGWIFDDATPRVLSKSRKSNDGLRSGVAQSPKFKTCASPQSCASVPEFGAVARPPAMTAAAPRK